MSTGQSEVANARRQQTLNGRNVFNSRFCTASEKSEHFRQLSRKSAESRIVLSADEAEALRGAYALLTRIAEHGKLTPPVSPNSEERSAA